MDKHGPAFPATQRKIYDATRGLWHETDDDRGMSLRDYFAAAACQGYLAAWTDSAVKPVAVAIMAYEVADAMLKERKRNT